MYLLIICADCGTSKINATEGQVVSPGYTRKKYVTENNLSCSYSYHCVKRAKTPNILIETLSFNLEDSADCSDEYVQVSSVSL